MPNFIRETHETHNRRGCLLLIFGSWIVWGALTVAAYWWVTH